MQDELDRELIEAAVSGNLESFGELCRRYYAAMVAIAYVALGDHQLAEDAVQESFARALVRLRSLKDGAKFASRLAGGPEGTSGPVVATTPKVCTRCQVLHPKARNASYLCCERPRVPDNAWPRYR